MIYLTTYLNVSVKKDNMLTYFIKRREYVQKYFKKKPEDAQKDAQGNKRKNSDAENPYAKKYKPRPPKS